MFRLPLPFVRFFLAVYSSCRRSVVYNRWCLPEPITTSSGVFQGCSLSLLCINLHMGVWALMMRSFDGVSAYAFIDDSYLLASQDALQQLQGAVEATRLWDELTGQALNDFKCNLFATSSHLRSSLQSAFPNMKLVEVVEILGSYLQTTKKNATGYPKHKVDAALVDCKLIGRLPVSLASKEHLVSIKVVPRIAFTPGMTRMPKAILEKIQSAIADTIWKDRPVWRSRSLLFAVLGKPHRSDPICARAYITIVGSKADVGDHFRSPGILLAYAVCSGVCIIQYSMERPLPPRALGAGLFLLFDYVQSRCQESAADASCSPDVLRGNEIKKERRLPGGWVLW